jgi:hypothetical protein
MKPMIRLIAILVLIMAIFSQSSTASAVSMFKFRGLGTNASFSSIDLSGCIQTNVDVFTAEAILQTPPGRGIPFSSVNLFISQHDLCTGIELLAAEGVADLAEPDLQIDSKLSWAVLNTTISMLDSLTGNTFDIFVNLNWTGVVPVTRDHTNMHFGDQDCRVLNHGVGTFRGSEASGSVSDGRNNLTPEPSLGALLIRSNSRDLSIGCN